LSCFYKPHLPKCTPNTSYHGKPRCSGPLPPFALFARIVTAGSENIPSAQQGLTPGIHLSSRRGNEFIALRLPRPLPPVYSQVSNELPECISEECFRAGIQSAGLPMQRSPCRILGVILPVFSACHKCNMIWNLFYALHWDILNILPEGIGFAEKLMPA
jgi:hypothetical protein